jgi:hypothetical protein
MERGRDEFGEGGGGGSGGNMLERRVAKLENDMQEVKASLKVIEAAVAEIKNLPKMADYMSIKTDLAEVKGKLSQSPTWIQMITLTIATWTAGATIVATLLRMMR